MLLARVRHTRVTLGQGQKKGPHRVHDEAPQLSTGKAVSRILSSLERSTQLTRGGDYSSGTTIACGLERTYPEARRWPRLRLNHKGSRVASLFDLAPCRVWLFSLQRLPRGLPCPTSRSLPWTFSLFHCSSPYDGGPLAPALPCGVRTFLGDSFEPTQSPAIPCRAV